MKNGVKSVPKFKNDLNTDAAEKIKIGQVIKNTTSLDELDEMAKAIQEARERISGVSRTDFWEERIPCWEISRCPDEIRDGCPAYKYRYLPCWQIEGTLCKLDSNGTRGDKTNICQSCRVYKKYDRHNPILLKLCGKGFNISE